MAGMERNELRNTPACRQGRNYELRIKYVIPFSIFYLLSSILLFAQEVTLQQVEPPFWWTGFKQQELQLMIYGKNIATTDVSITSSDITLKKVNKTDNPNYLFLDLVISENARQGNFIIRFEQQGKVSFIYSYELLPRKKGSAGRTSFSSSDVIYLLMPDRFANGDTLNDNIEGMKQKVNRSDPESRHGGDIRGIIDHLDYLKDMGFTALWINPLIENDMGKYSYHGYSATDFYKIDPRLGSNNDYLALSDSLHKRGMKLIMDMIFNHCGSEHWWMKDPPASGWFHQFTEFTSTSYRSGTVTDPYVSSFDSIKYLEGWFSPLQPDLNQHDPFLAKYLIQNSIWWIEYAGLDGIRMDTYPYSFRDFMAEWDKAILREYPQFNIVGECWLTSPESIASWQKDASNHDGFNSYLPSVFDFAMYDALRLGFVEKNGWNTGIFRIYEILSRDFVYPDPSKIVVFADNHDVDRFLASQNQDISKLKMAMVFLLTSRGIPQIYYGTEVLMTTGKEKNYEQYRKDFPGGWHNDTVNGFTGAGLSADQKEMQQFLKKLLNWRTNKDVIHNGKLTHFIPDDGVYVYFRHNEKEAVMVAINNNEIESKTLNSSRYSEFIKNYRSAREVISEQHFSDLSTITINPKSSIILELIK